MSHGLTLDHAAWSSPWRARSVRDKGLLSGGLLLSAITLPPIPGGAAVAVASLVLLLGPIRVGWARLGRIMWLPVVSILVGVATVAVSVSWDAGLRLQVTPSGWIKPRSWPSAPSRPPWPCSPWPARRR